MMLKNEIREMRKFGETVLKEGLDKLRWCKENKYRWINLRSELITKKRLAVVQLMHGFELIMKSVILQKGYLIYKLDPEYPIKSGTTLKNLLDSERTIESPIIREFIRGNYPEVRVDSIKKLSKIRNQIQHMGTRIDKKKTLLFFDLMDCLKHIYSKEKILNRKFLKKVRECEDVLREKGARKRLSTQPIRKTNKNNL